MRLTDTIYKEDWMTAAWSKMHKNFSLQRCTQQTSATTKQ